MSSFKQFFYSSLNPSHSPNSNLSVIKRIGAGLICLSFVIYCFVVGFKLFVIGSGSMEPAIAPGTVIITQPQNRYYPGEVITYRQTPATPGGDSLRPLIITHRVVHTQTTPAGTIYKTKGDSNQHLDNLTVHHSQILGKAIVAIPLLGFILLWPRSQLGFYFMILLPAAYIVIQQLIKIIVSIFHHASLQTE